MRVLESATLLNLIVLSAGTLYKWESTESKSIVLEVLIGITFAQFCVIVVLSLVQVLVGGIDEVKAMMSSMRILTMSLRLLTSELKILNLNHLSPIIREITTQCHPNLPTSHNDINH